jgi:hypothetical protein
VRFKGSSKTPQNFLGGAHVKIFCQKVEVFVSVISPLRFCFIAFLAVSLHDELKNAIKVFSKTRTKNLKAPQKKASR